MTNLYINIYINIHTKACFYGFVKYIVAFTELYAHIIWQTYLILTGSRPSTKGEIKNGK